MCWWRRCSRPTGISINCEIPAAFRAWLAQIARRVCWQLKEREALLPLLQLSTLEEEGAGNSGGELTPEAQLARRQMKQLLDDAIAALPELYREVYQLRDIEDRPGDEVAETGHFAGGDEIAIAPGAGSGEDLSGCSFSTVQAVIVLFVGGTHGSDSRPSGSGTV